MYFHFRILVNFGAFAKLKVLADISNQNTQIMSTHKIVLWRIRENYASIIIKQVL